MNKGTVSTDSLAECWCVPGDVVCPWCLERALAAIEAYNRERAAHYASPAGQKELQKMVRKFKHATGHPQLRGEF